MRLRPAATPEDFVTASRLFRRYAEGLGFDLEFQQFEAELASLPGAYAEPGGCILLAHADDGAPAGCVALRPLDEVGICEMKRLFVDPAFRGHGVGRALAAAVVEEAKARGYVRMRLDTVAGMVTAMEIYRALGFREIASYRFNPVPGARYFELEL